VAQVNERRLLKEDEVYELLAFLVTSAELLVGEPHLYGTFRLIDAASRMMAFALESGNLDDEFMSQFKGYVDTNKVLSISDEKAYVKFLEEASRMLARELKRRASTQHGGTKQMT
jgi:hypothetical protein